jgi:hypothetical protein
LAARVSFVEGFQQRGYFFLDSDDGLGLRQFLFQAGILPLQLRHRLRLDPRRRLARLGAAIQPAGGLLLTPFAQRRMVETFSPQQRAQFAVGAAVRLGQDALLVRLAVTPGATVPGLCWFVFRCGGRDLDLDAVDLAI